MIKLENVSTRQFIENLFQFKKQSINEIYGCLYNLLVSNNINNYQMLKDFLVTVKDEYVFFYLHKELNLVEEKVSKFNYFDRKAIIYTFDNYNECGIDNKVLEMTDQLNYGDVLICSSFFRNQSSKVKQLNNLTIKEIKDLASHLSRYRLKNGLIDIPSFGNASAEKVVDRVKFYEQQVLRQAKETDKRDINLFMLNKKEKEWIVELELEGIIQYILNSNDEFIWGTLTEEQRAKMIRILSSPLSSTVKQDKDTFINVISNYTTLRELEDGVVKNKTLSRFIVK